MDHPHTLALPPSPTTEQPEGIVANTSRPLYQDTNTLQVDICMPPPMQVSAPHQATQPRAGGRHGAQQVGHEVAGSDYRPYEQKAERLATTSTATMAPTPVAAPSQQDLNLAILQALQGLSAQLTQAKKVQDDPPVSFSGEEAEEPETFLARLEEWIRREGMTRQEAMQCARKSLRGIALRWFRDTCREDMDFDVFSSMFRDRFNSLAVISTLTTKLYGEKQKDKESASTFILGKWALFGRLAPTAPECLRTAVIREQLLPHIRVHTRASVIASMQQLLDVATQVERDLASEFKPATQQSRPLPMPAPRRPPPTPAPRQAMRPGEIPKTNDNGGSEARREERTPQAPRVRSEVPPHPCLYCGAMHYHNQCPKNPYKQGNALRTAAQGDARSEKKSQT